MPTVSAGRRGECGVLARVSVVDEASEAAENEIASGDRAESEAVCVTRVTLVESGTEESVQPFAYLFLNETPS